MGECASDWDWLYPEDDRTMILVGRWGTGKSATGNSIIEANVFDEMPSSACVTTAATALCNGHILTVIDTPGSFDVSVEPETIGLDTGIHAFLLVVSLIKRNSYEESLFVESLTRFFGAKLSDYMIVVFTYGEALGDEPLNDYLCRYWPDKFARILEMCGNRYVIFDNATEDKFKKYRQREELLRLVDEVVANNNGIPYTHELFVGQKASQIKSKLRKEYEDQLLEMESKHRETTLRLEKQLEGERVARLQAEADAQSAKTKSDNEISKARMDLRRAQREARKLRKTQRETKELFKKKIQERKNNTLAIAHQIESRLREMTLRLENQLADKFAQMQAQRKSDDEMWKLREDMERARKYADDAFKKLREDMEENRKKNNRSISEKTSANEHKIDSKNRERIVELEKMLAGEQVARMQAESKIESRLRETTLRLENQLVDKFAQMRAEDKAQRKSDDEMRKLREDMERARKYTEGGFKKLREDMEENQKKNDRAISEKTSANEHKLRERIVELEMTLADEQVARMQAEAKTQEVEKKLNDERENRSMHSVSKTNPSDAVDTYTSVFPSARRTPTDSPLQPQNVGLFGLPAPGSVFASSGQSRQIYNFSPPVKSWM